VGGILYSATGTAWATQWHYFNPSQHLAGLGCSAFKTIPSLCVPHPSYAVENRVAIGELPTLRPNRNLVVQRYCGHPLINFLSPISYHPNRIRRLCFCRKHNSQNSKPGSPSLREDLYTTFRKPLLRLSCLIRIRRLDQALTPKISDPLRERSLTAQ
jgi:hypothetical protein